MSYGLDRNGNFESQSEMDQYIAQTLKSMASEMRSQTPMMLDAETRIDNVMALGKSINFYMTLINYKSYEVDPANIARVAMENLDQIACSNKATRDLIDAGVSYIYIYSGNDGKFINRVPYDNYQCR
jgi:hypothetical protein